MAGYKVLAVPQAVFSGYFRGKHPGFKVTSNPLPDDAKVVSMTLNTKTEELEFVIYSKTYEFIKPGHPLPYIKPQTYELWEGK